MSLAVETAPDKCSFSALASVNDSGGGGGGGAGVAGDVGHGHVPHRGVAQPLLHGQVRPGRSGPLCVLLLSMDVSWPTCVLLLSMHVSCRPPRLTLRPRSSSRAGPGGLAGRGVREGATAPPIPLPLPMHARAHARTHTHTHTNTHTRARARARSAPLAAAAVPRQRPGLRARPAFG